MNATEILKALDEYFDADATCAEGREGVVPASRYIKKYNIDADWAGGFVWVNLFLIERARAAWVRKFLLNGSGIVLSPLCPEEPWFQELAGKVHVTCFMDDCVLFGLDGKGRGNRRARLAMSKANLGVLLEPFKLDR